jgi:hypothetical protein
MAGVGREHRRQSTEGAEEGSESGVGGELAG